MDIFDFARYGASYAVVAAGLFFVVVGAVGVVRFPDFYSRLHAAGVTDTLGAELVLIGLMLRADSVTTLLKLALIAFFLFLTSPTSTHAIANAAHTAGVKPLLGRRNAKGPLGDAPEASTGEPS
ncbi:MAG: monovalent cation/H(+) antiporter subunit G [Maricaulaceae bacterium]|jgi:multicomponent Na+:H+ antiporter subunit G